MSLEKEYLKRLRDYIDKEAMISKGEKLLLAVSAGADSTAMLYLFSRLRYGYNLSLLAVHINHQLRGEASDADEQHIKELCLKLNIPIIVRRIDLGEGKDVENRARSARFQIFRQILKSYRFQKVLLAHHKWDLAETVFLNLIRGSGLSGMAGIKPVQNDVLHPLLSFSPVELKSLLREVDISWREDASNLDLRYTRNRVRHELLPDLAEKYNPQIQDKLAEEANILQQADMYIQERALRRFKKVNLDNANGRVILSIPELLSSPGIEQYYILREAYRQTCGIVQDFYMIHMQDLKSLCSSQGSKYISLPHNVFAIKRYQELYFSSNEADIYGEASPALVLENDRNRAVHMNYRFRLKYLKVLPRDHDHFIPNRAIVDADKLKGKISIRARAAGDRFIPLGMGHLKKLKDFFIDEKVAKYDRDLVPIFADEDKIFWICGYRIDDRVRYDESSTRFLMIEAESLQKKANRAASRRKRGNNEFDEL